MNKIKGLLVGLALICFLNLIPYIMALLMLFTEETSITYSLFHIVQNIFSIPTSIIGFALQYDLGEVWWVILNIVILIIATIAIVKID